MKPYPTKLKNIVFPSSAVGIKEVAIAIFGSFVSIFLIGLLHRLSMETTALPMLIAPFGASAVLVFGAYKSPLAQPRNVIGGHAISALIGITIYQLAGGGNEIVCIGLAVALAIGAMQVTGTLHPPGGATAFITVAGGSSIHALGYWYVLTPCIIGSMIIVLMGIIVHSKLSQIPYPHAE